MSKVLGTIILVLAHLSGSAQQSFMIPYQHNSLGLISTLDRIKLQAEYSMWAILQHRCPYGPEVLEEIVLAVQEPCGPPEDSLLMLISDEPCQYELRVATGYVELQGLMDQWILQLIVDIRGAHTPALYQEIDSCVKAMGYDQVAVSGRLSPYVDGYSKILDAAVWLRMAEEAFWTGRTMNLSSPPCLFAFAMTDTIVKDRYDIDRSTSLEARPADQDPVRILAELRLTPLMELLHR